MMLRRLLPLALALPMGACFPQQSMDLDMRDDSMMMHHVRRHWPTVRIDGLDGARVTMRRGVFGDGIDTKAPFQGDFQPTGDHASSGYPLEIDLDEATSRRFGSEAPIRLQASLMVPLHTRRHGILRIDVSDCALRALVAGDLDVLKIKSQELPTADVTCAPPKKEEPKPPAPVCNNPGVLGAIFGTGSGGGMMKGWQDKMGWSHDGDKDDAIIEIAVMRVNDKPWR